MFKTKEELIKEFVTDSMERDHGYEQGIKDAFKSIAERIDFYRKYRHQMVDFREKYPQLYFEYEKSKISFFDDWLFNFCFDGVKK